MTGAMNEVFTVSAIANYGPCGIIDLEALHCTLTRPAFFQKCYGCITGVPHDGKELLRTRGNCRAEISHPRLVRINGFLVLLCPQVEQNDIAARECRSTTYRRVVRVGCVHP